MKLREATISISDKRMLSEKEACQYLGIGRNSCRKFAEEIGAVRHFGTRILYDRFKLDEALNKQNGEVQQNG